MTALDELRAEVASAARVLDSLDRDWQTRPADWLLDRATAALEALIGAVRDYLAHRNPPTERR